MIHCVITICCPLGLPVNWSHTLFVTMKLENRLESPVRWIPERIMQGCPVATPLLPVCFITMYVIEQPITFVTTKCKIMQMTNHQNKLLFTYTMDDTPPQSPTPCTSRTRCHHEFKVLHYQTNIDSYKYAFFPRTILDWNNLSVKIVNSSTLEPFKCQLYSKLANHY